MSRLPVATKDNILKGVEKELARHKKSGRSSLEYSVELKYWLQNQKEVSKVSLRGRNSITVEFSDKTRTTILLERENLYGGGNMMLVSNAVMNKLGRPLHWLKPAVLKPTSTDALLFDPLYDDWPPEATTNGIGGALEGAGYSITTSLGEDADLARFANVDNGEYGVIFIRSHGGIVDVDGEEKTFIMARPFFDSWPDPADSGFEGIEVFYVKTNWGRKFAYAFGEDFVRHHLDGPRFPSSVMHLLVCHGGDPAGEDDLIDAFLDSGVACLTGWTRNASLTHGDPAAVAFFEYLCGGFNRSVADAIDHVEALGHSPDSQTRAELVAYGRDSMCLRRLQIEIALNSEHLQVIEKHPDLSIGIILKGKKFMPDERDPHGPWGGEVSPVDRLGRRVFLSESSVDVMERLNMLESVLKLR